MLRVSVLILLFLINLIGFSQNNIKEYDSKLAEQRMEALNKKTPLMLSYNLEVEQYIKDYIYKNRDKVSELLFLAEYYFPIFEEALDRNNLPLEIKYLPIIESELNPSAKSPMGATGMWQIMFNTAKEYNLLISSYVDERMDVEKSTEAACKYFQKSYNRFNNWESSIASYNVGQYGVIKAMKRSGGKSNYWQYRAFLPPETQQYIPKFIAAIYVMSYADLYGIYPTKKDNNIYAKTDTVHIHNRLNLDILSNILEIDKNIVFKLNPSYKIRIIPELDYRDYYLRLPIKHLNYYLENQDYIFLRLKNEESEIIYPTYEELVKTIIYEVQAGDYLGKIANKYNCKTKDIMIWNDMNSTKIKLGEKLKIYVNADYE